MMFWTADARVSSRPGGLYCYPLTVPDNSDRFLLGCPALTSTAVHAPTGFSRLLQEFGLPRRSAPTMACRFPPHPGAAVAAVGLVVLGILPELIEPGQPQQNGRHQRMHRTLKAETTRPPAANCRAQPRKFNRFRQEFNHERPHEALDMQTPAARFEPSPRPMPDKLPPLQYPDRFEVRYVSANGGIRWNKRWVDVSTTCIDE